ncbi:Ig-like domain-containing protein [Pseudomonas paralactis]|uniref:Ig-like domain-containing protein n=1 Tax=Pseudomonas paralactis TaxID=1615673 RepID=UPI000AD4DF3E|nr:Ig-like domain-containing protein [Pseudomonas paralactis]
MSDYPDTHNDPILSAPDGASFPVACLSRQKESIVAGPQRLENLDHPYSAYPAIPLAHVPYEVAVYGLGIRHVRPYALYSFENWTSLGLNDYFAIYFDDLIYPAADGLVADDTLVRQSLAIPHVPEGEVVTYGRVLRAGSSTESTSPQRIILVKTTRPGGADTDPGSPWHTGLVMAVEGFPEGETLRLENVGLGLYCLVDAYENIRKNDVIELSWDGIFVLHTVTVDEADGAGPIRVFVAKSIIEQGGQRGTLTLRFRVRDVVENFSGEKYQYSKPYFLNAELDPNLLNSPIFLVDDEELDPITKQIDFDTQSGSTFELVVLTDRQFPTPSPRYEITVSLLCTRDDGTSETILLGPVPDLNRGFTYIPIDNDIIAQVVGGSLRASFIWTTDVAAHQSGSITITVVGTKVSMPAPSVSPIELGLIPVGEDITVTVPTYVPHNPGMLEEMSITHVPPGGGGAIILSREQLAGSQGGTYTFTAAEVAPFNGLGIDIKYTTNDGAAHILGGSALALRQSATLGAQVGERTADMPAPRLQGAIGNNVDPADVPGSDVLVTFTYLGTRDGDKLHWSCVGSGLGGSASGTIDINRATAGKELPYPVSRDILDKNLNGSLRISYSLESAGPPKVVLRSEVLVLTVGKGVQLDRPIIEGASISPDELNPLAALSGARVIVKFRPMLASDFITVDWITADDHGSAAKNVDGDPTTHEVSVLLDARTIAQGIREGGNTIDVKYHFHRGAFEYESLTVPLRLLALTGLPTPIIEDIGGPILDVSQLSPTARTHIPVWSFIHEDQLIWMTYESDSTVIEETYSANEVTDEGVRNGINPPTPVDKIKLLEDGKELVIKFLCNMAEIPDKSTAVLFGVRHYTIQAQPGVLPHPFINGTADTGSSVTVDPLPIEHNTTVTVSYTGMSGQDSITLEWIFADGTHHAVVENGMDGGSVVFNLTADKVLHRSVNSTVCLRYSVERPGVVDPIPSQVQRVKVNSIPVASLPQPRINNIQPGGSLDVNTFAGNGQASLPKWALSVQESRAFMTCTSPGVAPLNVLTVDGELVTSTEAANGLVNKAVLRSWLTGLPDKAQITVTVEVEFSGNTSKENAVEFPPTNYIVKTLRGITMDESTLYVNLRGWVLQNFGFTDVAYTGAVGRTATGGSGFLTYRSSNTSVVTVDLYSGRLTFTGVGSATITVSDTSGQSKGYIVQTSGGGRICRFYGGLAPWQTHYNQIRNSGAIMLKYDTARSLYSAFGRGFPHTDVAWVDEGIPPESPNAYYSVYLSSGMGFNRDQWSGNAYGYGIF